jgi:hypothetical protein
VKTQLREQGAQLPIEGDLRVHALFYRDADRGDLNGYQQALGDFLQEARPNRQDLLDLAAGRKKRTLKRDGTGIICDDSQIKSWGDSELFVDRENPRIEVTIEAFTSRQGAA